jgi:hypothetical protein
MRSCHGGRRRVLRVVRVHAAMLAGSRGLAGSAWTRAARHSNRRNRTHGLQKGKRSPTSSTTRRSVRRCLRPAAAIARSACRFETIRTGSPPACGENLAHHARAPIDERMRFEMSRAGTLNDGARNRIMIGATLGIRSHMSAIARQGFAMQRAERRGSRATVRFNQRKRQAGEIEATAHPSALESRIGSSGREEDPGSGSPRPGG